MRGGSLRDVRHFATSAVLVRRPAGDLLVDAGFGTDVAEHVPALPRLVRAPYRAGATAQEQLTASGYDLSRLLGVVVTHSHWDHVSGLDGLDFPVWMNAGELEYAREDPDGTVYRRVAARREIRPCRFTGATYLGFPASLDVHGDGSVVIVLAGGHTTGSVIVFVTVPSGQRYALIGDLTWQLDGITRRLERPFLLRRLADSDPEQVRRGLLKVVALAGLVQVVPAHDTRAYDGIPLLPAQPAARAHGAARRLRRAAVRLAGHGDGARPGRRAGGGVGLIPLGRPPARPGRTLAGAVGTRADDPTIDR